MQLPAWPFVGLSFGLGVLALGPYFALWTPASDVRAPPLRSEMGGWRNLSLRITESRITAAVLLLATVVTLGQARRPFGRNTHVAQVRGDCSCAVFVLLRTLVKRRLDHMRPTGRSLCLDALLRRLHSGGRSLLWHGLCFAAELGSSLHALLTSACRMAA